MHLIKKLPLMAFVLGLGFIGIASGFKAEKKLADQRYYNTSTGWKTETEIIQENPDSHPACTGEEETLCSGVYSDEQTPGVDTPTSQQLGTYQLIPD